MVVFAAYWGYFWICQNRILFPTHKLKQSEPLSVETFWLNFEWGKTEALFLPGSGEGALPTVIVAHGQMGLIDGWYERLSTLQNQGMNCLLVEFPGYGRSEGVCSVQKLKETFCAAYDWAIAQPSVDASQIIGLGRSMGGGVITQLAKLRTLRCLWLMSTFTSLRPFIAKKWIPPVLLNDSLNTLTTLRQLDIPCLILHGASDDVIPAEHSRVLANVVSESQLMMEPGDHEHCPADWERFLTDAVEYYQKLVAAPSKH